MWSPQQVRECTISGRMRAHLEARIQHEQQSRQMTLPASGRSAGAYGAPARMACCSPTSLSFVPHLTTPASIPPAAEELLEPIPLMLSSTKFKPLGPTDAEQLIGSIAADKACISDGHRQFIPKLMEQLESVAPPASVASLMETCDVNICGDDGHSDRISPSLKPRPAIGQSMGGATHTQRSTRSSTSTLAVVLPSDPERRKLKGPNPHVSLRPKAAPLCGAVVQLFTWPASKVEQRELPRQIEPLPLSRQPLMPPASSPELTALRPATAGGLRPPQRFASGAAVGDGQVTSAIATEMQPFDMSWGDAWDTGRPWNTGLPSTTRRPFTGRPARPRRRERCRPAAQQMSHPASTPFPSAAVACGSAQVSATYPNPSHPS